MSALLPMCRQDGELHPTVLFGVEKPERLVVVVGVWLLHRSLKRFQEGRYLPHSSSTEPACTVSLERTHALWHFFVGGILYVSSGHDSFTLLQIFMQCMKQNRVIVLQTQPHGLWTSVPKLWNANEDSSTTLCFVLYHLLLLHEN